MCGIAGWYCFGRKRPPVNVLRGLMLAQGTRGQNAAGIGWEKAAAIQIRKQKGPAHSLVKLLDEEHAWEEIVNSPRGIIHARATTKGSENDNRNNHPVHGFGWAIVHNGHISNDDELFAYYKKPRFAEVDTSAIPLVLSAGDTYENSLQHLTVLGGAVTAAAWSGNAPDRIALVRLGFNELYLLVDTSARILYWSSAAVGAKVVPGFGLGGVRFLNAAMLKTDRIMVLQPDWTKVEVYEVERKPYNPFAKTSGYRHPAMVGIQTKLTSPGKTAGSSTPSNTIIAGESIDVERPSRESDIAVTRVSWRRHDKEFWGYKKPSPEIADLRQMEYFQYDLRLIHAQFFENTNLQIRTVNTPYGRWVFRREKEDQIARQFYPRKALKKLYRRKFERGWDALLNLPLTEPAHLAIFDSVGALETFEITERRNTGSLWMIVGFMCPWCGIIARNEQWHNHNLRCQFCNIKGLVSPSVIQKA